MASDRVERRLAAILAADVAGYSRLVGSDEEGTLAALKALRKSLIDPKITEHRGRIVKNMGDGALVEFASAVDAVRCAVEIQRGMANRKIDVPEDCRIQFRIGINIGDIVIEEGDIFGDGVNIAARLESIAAPGGVCISEDVYRQVRGKLDTSLEDIGEQKLKNIVQPVRAYRLRIVGSSANASTGEHSTNLPLPDKPSIAVLAFQNMSGDVEQEYFADGIAEDIITALSKSRWLFVIARNSSFTYKGRAVDIKQIGRELGVRYVLEGSVRKSANRVRITGQLVEASTGAHLWAERYDRDLTDIFAVQDEITESVASAIEPAMAQAERLRVSRKPPDSLVAWEAYHRGLWHFLKQEPSENDQAKAFFQRTIDLDPGFAGGFYGLALTHVWDCWVYVSRPAEDCVSVALPLAQRALKLDDADPMAHLVTSFALMLKGDADEAVPFAQQAVSLNPNSAWAVGFLGGLSNLVNYSLGDGLARLRKAMRISPHDPMLWTWTQWSAIGHYFAHDYAAALEASYRVIRLRPDHPLGYLWKAAALAQLDRVEEAKKALQRAVEISPANVEAYRHTPARFRQRSADYAHFLKGLRKAGLADEPSLALPDKPSIAVLPFQNMSGDPEQEYFADGIVEDVITALSRFKNLFVIARNSSFTYKGRAVDVKQVGRELGVRYILEGSVRRSGNRVRITGQLIDTSNGTHLWADRFDGSLEDIFDLQDSVTASVVGAIAPKLETAEIERAKRKPTDNLDAYDYCLRGIAALHRVTREGNSEALRSLYKAIELDPEYAAGYGLAAWCYVPRVTNNWTEDRARETAEAARLAHRAMELGKGDAVALCGAAFALGIVVGDLDNAAAYVDRALLLNPNFASAWLASGWIRVRLGEAELGLEHLRRAQRFSPLDPLSFVIEGATAAAHFFAGRYEDAIAWAEKALTEEPNYGTAARVAAASYALIGRFEEAAKAIAQLQLIDPKDRIANLKDWMKLRRPQDIARIEDGLRKAGLPE